MLMRKDQMEAAAHQNAARFRERNQVSRVVTNYWLAELFRQQKAQDPTKRYSGILLTWVRQVRVIDQSSSFVISICFNRCLLTSTLCVTSHV